MPTTLRSMLVAVLCCSAAALGAATIDVDYAKVKEGKLGMALAATLATEPVNGAEAPDPLAACTRVLVTWSGPKQPPVARFLGVSSEAYLKRLAEAGAVPIDTKFGPAYPLQKQKGFAVVALGASELMMAPPTLLATIDAPAWPELTTNVMSFSGPATDLNLGDLQDELKDFVFAWEQSGAISLHAVANSKSDAKAVLRYISVREPLLDAAAALGVDKAVFPAKLLGATTFDRQGTMIIAKLDLDDATRAEAMEYLSNQVRKQMKKYR
jgi:hypothetical protein